MSGPYDLSHILTTHKDVFTPENKSAVLYVSTDAWFSYGAGLIMKHGIVAGDSRSADVIAAWDAELEKNFSEIKSAVYSPVVRNRNTQEKSDHSGDLIFAAVDAARDYESRVFAELEAQRARLDFLIPATKPPEPAPT